MSAAIRCDAFGRRCDKVTGESDTSWYELRRLDPHDRTLHFCSLKCLQNWAYCARSTDNCK